MSINKQSDGYALSLLVGINDTFTKQSNSIKQEANRLEKEIKDLQKTTGDVTKFKKAQESLEDLEKQQLDNKTAIEKQKDALKKLKKESGETAEYQRQQRALQQLEKENRDITASTREYERQLRRLRSSLGEAGIDVKNLAADEARLKEQINKSNNALQEQNQSIKEVGQSSARTSKLLENLGAVAGAAVAAKNMIFSANDADRNARLFAARTGQTYEQVTAPEQRQFRADLMRKYNVNSGEAFNAQMMATQQGSNTQERQQLAESALALFSIDPNLTVDESMRAIKNASRSFNVSPQEAANRILDVYQQGGMINSGDLLDTFSEYSSVLGDQMQIDQFAAMLIAGNQAGVWNYDKVGDSLKETFRARFSDAGEFAKLVGDSSTTGAIDGIQNADLRKRLFDASNSMRNAYKSGTGQSAAYANMMQVLAQGVQLEPSNIKPVLEAVGGVIFSEDLGVKGILKMADAANNKGNYLNNVNAFSVGQSTLTSIDKAQGQLNSTTSAVNDKFGELLHSTDSMVDAFDGLSQKLTTSIIDSPSSAFASVAAVGVLGYGAIKGKVLGNLLGKILGNGSLGRFTTTGTTAGTAAGTTAGTAAGTTAGTTFARWLPQLGTLLYGLSMADEFSPIAFDRASERDDRASFFGFKSSDSGRLGINQDAIPKKVGLLDVWDEWMGNNTSVADTESMVSNMAATSTPTSASQSTPSVQVVYQPQIHVEAAGASPEQAQALSINIADALRNQTPELKQELKNIMSDLMQESDYLKH